MPFTIQRCRDILHSFLIAPTVTNKEYIWEIVLPKAAACICQQSPKRFLP